MYEERLNVGRAMNKIIFLWHFVLGSLFPGAQQIPALLDKPSLGGGFFHMFQNTGASLSIFKENFFFGTCKEEISKENFVY